MKVNWFEITSFSCFSYGKPVSGSIYWQVKLKRSPTLNPVVIYQEPGTFLLVVSFMFTIFVSSELELDYLL